MTIFNFLDCDPIEKLNRTTLVASTYFLPGLLWMQLTGRRARVETPLFPVSMTAFLLTSFQLINEYKILQQIKIGVIPKLHGCIALHTSEFLHGCRDE